MKCCFVLFFLFCLQKRLILKCSKEFEVFMKCFLVLINSGC